MTTPKFPSELKPAAIIDIGDYFVIEKTDDIGVEVSHVRGQDLKPLSTRIPLWQPDTAYIANELIQYEESIYAAIANFTSGEQFNVTNWRILAVKRSQVASWQAFSWYYQNEMVTHEGSLYRALANFTSGPVFSPTNWERLSGDPPVKSVFTRTGDIEAEADDYAASHITNDSVTPEEYVDGALNGLNLRVSQLEQIEGPVSPRGGWDVVENSVSGDPLNTSLTKGQAPNSDTGDPRGYAYIVIVGGEFDLTDLPGPETWATGDFAVWTEADWIQVKSNAVTSVFGRTGVVIAEPNDYPATFITNDSQVSGDFVDDALNTLDNGKAPTVHTHVEADITDLDKYTQAEVDASQAVQDLRLDALEQAGSTRPANTGAGTVYKITPSSQPDRVSIPQNWTLIYPFGTDPEFLKNCSYSNGEFVINYADKTDIRGCTTTMMFTVSATSTVSFEIIEFGISVNGADPVNVLGEFMVGSAGVVIDFGASAPVDTKDGDFVGIMARAPLGPIAVFDIRTGSFSMTYAEDNT